MTGKRIDRKDLDTVASGSDAPSTALDAQDFATGPDPQARAATANSVGGRVEELLRTLRYSESPAERAAAARELGETENGLATANLVAALFDPDVEVREAAAAALNRIDDPAVAAAPMRALVANTGAEPEITSEDSTDFRQPETAEVDIQHLVEQERAAREAIADLESQLVNFEVEKATTESDLRLADEREARLEASIVALASEEKELRERADETAARRGDAGEELRMMQAARAQTESNMTALHAEADGVRKEIEQVRLLAEQYSREIIRTEAAHKRSLFAAERAEAHRKFRQTETLHRSELERLHEEETELRKALEHVALTRIEIDTARQEAEKHAVQLQEKQSELAFAETRRRDEIQQAIRAAEVREQNERQQLRQAEEELRETVEQITLRRGEIESALEEARDSAARLAEVQARVETAAEARRRDEEEYARLEAQASQQAREATQRLEAFRLRFQEEQRRLENQAAETAVEEQRRLTELETFRRGLEAEARRRSAKERAIEADIQQLLQADAAQREEIERAEERLQALSEQHRLADKDARLRLDRQERDYEFRRQANEEARLKVEEEIRRRIADEQHLKHEAEEVIRRLRIDARREAENRIQRVAQLEAMRQQLANQAAAELAREEHLRNEIEELEKEEQKLRLRIQSEARLRATIEERVQREKERLHPGGASSPATPERASFAGRERAPRSDWFSDLQLPPQLIAGLSSTNPDERAAAVTELANFEGREVTKLIAEFFDDSASRVRNSAAVALNELEATGSVENFTRAIETASPDRRRNIGAAIAASGIAAKAINELGSDSREENYNALSLLFTMAKTGEIAPLVEAVEHHDDVQVRRAAIRLLNLVGLPDVANAAAKRRLLIRPELG